MGFSYVQFFDKGIQDGRLWINPNDDPNDYKNIIDFEQDEETKEWFTTLDEVELRSGAVLISVTPYEQITIGEKTIIKNKFIFRTEVSKKSKYIE